MPSLQEYYNGNAGTEVLEATKTGSQDVLPKEVARQVGPFQSIAQSDLEVCSSCVDELSSPESKSAAVEAACSERRIVGVTKNDVCFETAETGNSAMAPRPESELSCLQKMRLPLASFGSMTIGSSLLSQPAVYISVFGGSATAIGVINIVMAAYDILNTPLFGWMSDRGCFNILCFKDGEKWGRRAPMALWSLPITAIGFWCNWVGPESFSDPMHVHLWFLMVRFLLSTSLGMFWTANYAAFTEVFPHHSERNNMAMARGIASGIAVGVGAGFISSLAVSVKASNQQSLYMAFAIISLMCVLITIPWCLLMSVTVMTDAAANEHLLALVKSVWCTGNPVRILALSFYFNSSAGSIAIPLLPFFLRQCFGFSRTQAALGFALSVGTFTITFLIGFPVTAFLNHRFHPVKVMTYSGLVGDSVFIVCCVLGS